MPPSLRADEAPPRVPALLDLRGQAAALAPTLPAVAHLYEDAQDTWRGRMVNEHESSEVFAALARQIDAARLPPAWSEACRGFADEERRHGVLCGAVLTALGGEALAAGSARAPFPEHDDVAGLEGVVRNVLSVCCLSETVAVALIGAERLQMPDGELRELLTAIYADEVGHARFGWKLIAAVAPSLDADQRARLGDYLAVAFDHLERHELEHLPLATPPPEGAALGLCQGAEARTLFYETVTEVIVPALEAAGLPARVAWAQRGPAAASAMAA